MFTTIFKSARNSGKQGSECIVLQQKFLSTEATSSGPWIWMLYMFLQLQKQQGNQRLKGTKHIPMSHWVIYKMGTDMNSRERFPQGHGRSSPRDLP